MSTNAAVFVKNENGTYTGTEICHDGYIQLDDKRGKIHGYGAGYMLGHYWQDIDDIKNLIKKGAVRSLGKSIEDTAYMNYHQTGLDNLSWDDLKNLGYSYIYIFKNDFWSVLNPNSKYKNRLFNLNCFLDYDDPERWTDNEDFWK